MIAWEFCFFGIVTDDLSEIRELSQFIQEAEAENDTRIHIWLASLGW